MQSVFDVILTAANKPVAMQSNPAYGTAVRKDTITNTEPVMTVQS